FNPSIGALHGTLAKAAVAGVATFNDLSIDASGLGYTLGVIDGTLQGATSTAFNINSAAHHLAFDVQPTSTIAGNLINPPITVRVLDQFDNLVIVDNSQVTIAIGNNPGGSPLGGTTTVTVVNGIATFSDLYLTKTGVGYTLTA